MATRRAQAPSAFLPQTSPVGAKALPVSAASGGYIEEARANKYRNEIREGKRRENGALNLKRLTGRHIAILNLHLLGNSNRDVAKHMNITESRVSLIIHDPLAEAYLQRSYENNDKEFSALYGKSVEVVRGAMDSPRVADQLRAVDLYWKKRGDYNEPGGGNDTAEDVVQRVLNMQVNVSVGGKQLPSTEVKVLENKDE